VISSLQCYLLIMCYAVIHISALLSCANFKEFVLIVRKDVLIFKDDVLFYRIVLFFVQWILADWYFRGLVSSAWAQVNIKDQFLTPKMSTPVKPGSTLHLFVTLRKNKKKRNTHKYLGELHMGPRENVNNQHCQFRSDQKYQDHKSLPNLIVSLIFVIACQTNTWTSTLFLGAPSPTLFLWPQASIFCV
jgi:hypothetical protein